MLKPAALCMCTSQERGQNWVLATRSGWACFHTDACECLVSAVGFYISSLFWNLGAFVTLHKIIAECLHICLLARWTCKMICRPRHCHFPKVYEFAVKEVLIHRVPLEDGGISPQKKKRKHRQELNCYYLFSDLFVFRNRCERNLSF